MFYNEEQEITIASTRTQASTRSKRMYNDIIHSFAPRGRFCLGMLGRAGNYNYAKNILLASCISWKRKRGVHLYSRRVLYND